MANNPALLTTDEKLKSSIYHSVSKICHSVGRDNEVFGQCSFTEDAVELISEIIYKKLEVYSEDLEAFSKNRKQSTVNVDDVKLLARRNPYLKEHITKMITDSVSNRNGKKKKTTKSIKSSIANPTPTISKTDLIEID